LPPFSIYFRERKTKRAQWLKFTVLLKRERCRLACTPLIPLRQNSKTARHVEVARDYLERAARIDELSGHPPGSDGQMAAALKRYNGGRLLVFVIGAFAGAGCWSS